MKKIQLIAVLIILCVAFNGCSGKPVAKNDEVNNKKVTAPGELPIVKEKVTLTLGVLDNPKIEDYSTNEFTKYLEEKTNIDLEFYMFPASGATEKLNVMLGSNTELPEVLIGFNIKDNMFLKYANVFLPLDDYIEKNGFWINEMFEKSNLENIRNYLVAADGNCYWMPYMVEQRGNEWGGKSWINQKWLDKLGLQLPKTTEDLRKVLRAFKTQDPNGNGLKDEIGFTGSKNGWNESPVSFLVNSFIYNDYGKMITVDDSYNVNYAYMQPEFKEAIKYIKELADEKLLDIQCYTQDNKTLKSLAASKDEILGAFASGSPDVLHSDNMERMKDYVALPPLMGPNGISYSYKNPSVPRCAGVITKYCKNPLAAFRLLDFMLSEEASVFARYGVEGQDWEKAKANDKSIFEGIGVKPKIRQILPYGVAQNSHWMQINPQYRFFDIAEGITWNGNVLDGEYIKAKALEVYMGKEPKNVFVKQLLTLEETSEYDELYNSIHPYAVENISLFITGRRNVDSEWNNFVSELKKLGADRYVELTQIGYDRFRKEK